MFSFSAITELTNEFFTARKSSIQNFVSKQITGIQEAFDKKRQFHLDLLNVDEFVKVNEIKEITNPIFFIRDGIPTPDGLLSNEIFGITKEQRAGTFGYIDLGGLFMNPLCYKVWSRMDSKVKNIVHEINTYKIENGKFIEDPDGGNGVKFLKDNFENVKFTSSGHKKDMKIRFLEKAYKEGTMFLTKYPVIPAYYRDVDTSRGRLGVGEINEMYCGLLNASRALKTSAEYGLSLNGSTRGRIQEILLNIYNWFAEEPNISKKHGIIKRAVLSKTTDYATRMVISSPDLNSETIDELMVDTDHCALPLASALVNFYPFVMYYLTTFFTKEFSGKLMYDVINQKTGKIESLELGDWQETFSPINIKKQIDRYVHGFSNRFIRIEVPIKNSKSPCYMVFKGHQMSPEEYARSKGVGEAGTLIDRTLTWCDLFYMAAVEITRDKCVLITRYPIDSCYNQYPSLIRVSSTLRTEPMVINNTFYPHYPYIREDNIGKNTSNLFIDTFRVANPMLVVMGGDYDGDQVTVKGIYFDESNAELRDYINSKRQFISFGGHNMRVLSKQGIQCFYNLTLILPETEITKTVKLG